MFKELIGDDFYGNFTLETTCWSLVPFQTAAARETDLKTSTNLWKALVSKGARLVRIPESATEVKDLIYQIASHRPIILQTKRDVVDLGKSFSSLAIANLVDNEFDELRKQQEAESQKLRRQEEAERARQERKQEEEL